MSQNALALPILIATVSVALVRPTLGRFRIGHATAALTGAFLALATGAVSAASAWQALHVLLYPVVTIVSLMALTVIAERAGLFELLAARVARLARGDGRRLFTLIFFTGTLTGAVFTNDAAVLIFTPLIYRLIQEVGGASWGPADRMPYYFAVLYVANLVGAFVISNPINLIVASFFEIEFVEYARWMVLPAAVSMVASYLGLRLFFRRRLAERFDAARLRPRVGSPRFALLTGVVFFLTLTGFFVERLVGVPVWAVAAAGAATLLALSVTVERVGVVPVARGIGWDVIVFVAGIFVIISGMREAGLTAQLERLITTLGGLDIFGLIMSTGFVAAISSAVMNNHPTAYTMALAINDMPLEAVARSQWAVKRMLVFAALIGGDLGPKMLPIGSLAALLWFRMLRQRGVEVPYALYVKVGVPVTLAVVFLSLLTLYLEYLVVMGP